MKERMTKFLQELYSNLGLPKEVLTSVAGMALIGMSESATDEEIKSRAEETYVSEMLKSFQSHADKRAADAKKGVIGENKGVGEEKHTNVSNNELSDLAATLQQIVDAQKTQNEALIARLEALEGADTTKKFENLVASIGREFELEGSILDLCKEGLSSGMDEKQIRDALGTKAKILKDHIAAMGGNGSNISGTATEAQVKQWEQEEKSWVDAKKNK